MKTTLLFIILTINLNAFSQFLPITLYSSQDGLASTQVTNIEQDSEGAMWFGCGSGLSRFTGFKFKNFYLKEGLPDLSILKIKTTSQGHIIVLTYKGIAIKFPQKDNFVAIKESDGVTDIDIAQCSKTPKIYAAKSDGFFVYNIKTKKWTKIVSVRKKPQNFSLLGKKILFSSANGGIYYIPRKDNSPIAVVNSSEVFSFKKVSIFQSLAIGKKHVYLIETNGTNFNLKLLYKTKEKSTNIYDALIDSNGTLWVGTNRALIKITENGKNEYTEDNGIPELPIICIFESREHILWLGTNAGVIKLTSENILIYKNLLKTHIRTYVSLFWDNIEKKMWIGTNRGVYYIKGKETKSLNNDYLKHYMVWAISRDNEGNYYFGTEGGGLVKIDKNGKQRFFLKSKGELPGDNVTDLVFYKDKLYITCKEGFAVLKKNKIKVYTTENGLPANYIRAVDVNEKGEILLATYGASIIKFEKGQFYPLSEKLSEKYPVIYDIKCQNGIVWAATSKGLLKVSKNTAEFYGTEAGFPNYSQTAILPIKNFVWVGTDGGACLFDVKKKKVVNILTQSDGLPGSEFTTHNALERDGENNVWFALFGGLAKLNELGISCPSKKHMEPKLSVSSISYYLKHRKVTVKPRETKSIKIPYGSKDISLNLDFIWYGNEYSIKLYYKIEGDSNKWKPFPSLKNTVININSLSYGTYKVVAKIETISGDKKERIKDILTINVPTPWLADKIILAVIFALIGALGGLLTWLIAEWKTRHLEEEKRYLDAIVKERTKALEQMNKILQEKNKELENLAEKDFLTDLYNRRFIMKIIKHFLTLSDRDPNFKLSFILIDIDDFKNINDTYGHDAGDEVLKQLAALLKNKVRKSDIVSRWGGEEFLVLLPKTDMEGAKHLAEKIRKEIEKQTFTFGDKKMHITVSIGVSAIDLSNNNTDKHIFKTLVEVDKKLYKAKKTGKNKIVF